MKVVKGVDLNVCMVSNLYMYWVLIVYLVSLRVFQLSSHRGGVAKIKGTGKTRRKGAHDGLTSFSVHRNLVPPFTILSMTCQFMNPQH